TSATGSSRPGRSRQIAAASLVGRRYWSGRFGANAHAHQTTAAAASTRSQRAPAGTAAQIGTANGTSQSPYRLGPGVPPLLKLVVCVKLSRKSAATAPTVPPS